MMKPHKKPAAPQDALVAFDPAAFTALAVPEACRPGVEANLALLNAHAVRVAAALEPLHAPTGVSQ